MAPKSNTLRIKIGVCLPTGSAIGDSKNEAGAYFELYLQHLTHKTDTDHTEMIIEDVLTGIVPGQVIDHQHFTQHLANKSCRLTYEICRNTTSTTSETSFPKIEVSVPFLIESYIETLCRFEGAFKREEREEKEKAELEKVEQEKKEGEILGERVRVEEEEGMKKAREAMWKDEVFARILKGFSDVFNEERGRVKEFELDVPGGGNALSGHVKIVGSRERVVERVQGWR